MSQNKYATEWEEERPTSRKPITHKERGFHSEGIRNLPHFCRKGSMHTCRASDSSDRQKNCHFHIKSTHSNHCMELRFEEFCANHVLHRYVQGGIGDDRANVLVKREKKKHATIQNRIGGYHVDFPLEGEEIKDDVQRIFNDLCDLGISSPEFWVDQTGKSATEYDNFSVSEEDVIDGKWCPKRKELKKDILKYFEIAKKFL
ncbi:MAG: hypothetical protein ACTSRU_12535 [Candidatus Hodarchaeales archaeon]